MPTILKRKISPIWKKTALIVAASKYICLDLLERRRKGSVTRVQNHRCERRVGGWAEVNPSSNRAVFPHCTQSAATIAPKWIFRPEATSLARSLEFYVFGIN
jgi:hypothetical protein